MEDPKQIYQIVKHQLDEQHKRSDSLDNKAVFLFGAILVFLGIFLDQIPAGSPPLAFVIGLVFLGLALLTIVLIIRPRDAGSSPKPEALLKRAEEDQPMDQIYGDCTHSVVRMYNHNFDSHESRAKLLSYGFSFAAIGVALLAGSVLFSL